MAYVYVETSTEKKHVFFRVLAAIFILAFSLIFILSKDVATANINSGFPTSKSSSNRPSESYKVRTSAVDVQAQGKILTGNGVVIGIFDGGINLDNPAFQTNGQSRIISQACVGDSAEINICETDPSRYANNVCFTTDVGCFHGMAVAGFAAANENVTQINSQTVDVSGIATSAKISYVRQAMSKEGEIRYGDLVSALNKYVDDVRTGSPVAPDVINLSLSFPRSGYPNCEANNEVKKAIDYLTNAGVVVVAASGNNSDKSKVAYPACMQNVIAVGSSGINTANGVEEVSDFSNMSPEVDIVAPGENQIGLMPENNRYVTVSGTSFAAPIVSGAVVLMKEANPAITTSEVLGLFANSSDSIIDPATGQSFSSLNVQKLFGPNFENLPSKRQLTAVNSNDLGIESASDPLLGSDESYGEGISGGVRSFRVPGLSTPIDLRTLGTLNALSIFAVVLALVILVFYFVSMGINKRSKPSLIDLRSPVRLNGYYLNNQLIDLTIEDEKESSDRVTV